MTRIGRSDAHQIQHAQRHEHKTTARESKSQETSHAQPARPAAHQKPADLVDSRRGIVNTLRSRLEAELSRGAAAVATRTDIGHYNRPLKDRQAGDPDRNRAVNPTVVRVVEGRTLYPMSVRGDAHFFDRAHRSRGEIRGREIHVDFGRQKFMTSADGKRHRYVYAHGVNEAGQRTVGFVRLSALTDRKADVDRAFRFPVAPGTLLRDGMGVVRGELSDGSVARGVRLNTGQMKVIEGEPHYYAFSVGIKGGKPASGWIPASALHVQPRMRIASPPPAPEGDTKAYTLTGGDPAEYGDLRVTPENRKGVGNREAADYLVRSDGVVNMLFNLPGAGSGRYAGGGFSTDTFRVDQQPPVTFHRVMTLDGKGRVERPLYRPGSSEPSGRTMPFVYGYVESPDTGQRRYGWIALDALTPRNP